MLSNQGNSIDEISAIYAVRRNSVSNWFNRYDSEGIDGLHTAKGKGRAPIVRIDNISEITQIEKWVKEHAQNLKPVLVKIENNLNKKMSKKTLKRLLKKKVDMETFSQSNT